MTQKPLFYANFLAIFFQMPLRNSISMATPKIPGDPKLFERVCYMSKRKVTKFQLPSPNGFWGSEHIFKKQLVGKSPPPPPIQNSVKNACPIWIIHISVKWQWKIKTNISKFLVSSLVIQTWFDIENSSFVVHFKFDQTGVLVLRHPVFVFFLCHGDLATVI